MKSRHLGLLSIPRWASIAAVLLVLAPGTVFASHFELARLANQIELISGQLAEDLRYTRHYGSVRQRAVTLRREASQLGDSLRRNRSNSRIRSQFKDVRRGYERLEQAFFVADRRDHDPRLYGEVSLLSNLFTSLSDEYYYAGFGGGQSYGPFYNAPYSGIAIINSRNYDSRNYDSRNFGGRNSGARSAGSRNRDTDRRRNARDADRRDHDSRSNGRIVPSRERAIPPAFRGNSDGAVSGRQGGRNNQGRSAERERPNSVGLGRVPRVVQRAPSFDHSSNVLDRQARQNTQRREAGNQSRNNRSSVSPRQSPRGTNVQRGRGGVSGNRRRD